MPIFKIDDYKWDAIDKKNSSINARVMNTVYCSLTAEEFNFVSSCVPIMEIWRTLEVTPKEPHKSRV